MSNRTPAPVSPLPRGSPSAMADAVFSRHASLSEQLRTASTNLQQSLDALGAMGPWESDIAALPPSGSPYSARTASSATVGNGSPTLANRGTRSPSGTEDSPQVSLLIQRIQELEGAQQRQLKEQGDLRMTLVVKDEKMRKMVAAHKRLKSKQSSDTSVAASPVQQRHAQSMEARKRAAEAAATKAIAEKKELQREAQKLQDQLATMTSIEGNGGGQAANGGGEALRRETAARIRAENELKAARTSAAAGTSPGASAIQRERDALRSQLQMLKADIAKKTAGHRFVEDSGAKRSGSLLNAKTREEAKENAERFQGEIEVLSAARAGLEEQAAANVATRTEAEMRAAASEALTEELARALQALKEDYQELEKKEATMVEQQRMVAELKTSTGASIAGERQLELESVQQTEDQKRSDAEQTLAGAVDDVVSQAEARFEGALSDIEGTWAGNMEGTEAAIAAAKQQVADEYKVRISELTSALDQVRAEATGLKRVATEHAQQAQTAERQLAEQKLASEKLIRDSESHVRSDSEASAQQQVDAAKAEAEAGWSELVNILQTQAQESQQESLTAKRKATDSSQALAISEAETSELRKQIAKLHHDLSTSENRTPLEDPNAELERQELFNQLAATESRASKLEEQYKESVKKAMLDAEQQTLEDVEEIIQGLEDSNKKLTAQLAEAIHARSATADVGSSSDAEVAILEGRVAELSSALEDAQDSSALDFAMETAADAEKKLRGAEAKLAEETAQRGKLTAELDQVQLELRFAESQQPAETSTPGAATVDSRVAFLTEELANSKNAAMAAEAVLESTERESEGFQAELQEEKEARSTSDSEKDRLQSEVASLSEKLSRVDEAVPPVTGLTLTIGDLQTLSHDGDHSGVGAQLALGGSEEHSVSMHTEHLKALYAIADVNGDGNVSRAELVEALRRDTSLQSLFNLPVGKRLGAEERAYIEEIFDDMDDDHSFGISYEEFSTYVQKKYAQLPSLPAGSYVAGQRVVSVAADGSLTVTDPSELSEQRKTLFHDAGPPMINSKGRPVSPAGGPEPEAIAVSPRRASRRGGVFTYHTGDEADEATKQIAELVGVEKIGMENIVCDEFFGRRHRFRSSMKHKVRQELKLNKRAPKHSMDLPGFWTRPTLSEPYAALMEPFTIKVHLPAGAVVELDVVADQQMLELLELIVSECEDVEEDSVPEEGAVGFVLKARGVYNYLDGDEKLTEYTYFRDQLSKRLVPEVIAIPREDAIEDRMRFEAPPLTEADWKDSDSEDEEDYELMERKFDMRAVKSSWPFIPVSELRSSLRITLSGVDNLMFEDKLPDPWVDPFRAATWISPKTPKGRRGSVMDFGMSKESKTSKKEAKEAEAMAKVETLPRMGMEASGANMRKKRSSLHGNEKALEVDENAGADMVYVEAGLYFGGEQVSQMVRTTRQPRSANPHFNEVLDFGFPLNKLPRSSKICFTIWKVGANQHEADAQPLGWIGMYVFDDLNRLRQGAFNFACWPMDPGNPIGTCEENMGADPEMTPALTIQLDKYPKTVLFPRNSHLTGMPRSSADTSGGHSDEPWTSTERERVKQLLLADPLESLSGADKKLMWKLRYMCTTRPEGLAKVLRAADWTAAEDVSEVHRLLDEWEPLTAKQALELLDAHYPDERVRSYAVDCLRSLPDDELSEYVLQLVQVLKYEQAHDSTLACFLITRSMLCPNLVGHNFFWHLKAEMHVAEISERYGLVLELYLEFSAAHRADLFIQNTVMELLLNAARAIKDKSVKKKDRLVKLREVLAATVFPEEFGMALNPEWRMTRLKVEKCRYMDSKKLPLWLHFVSADPRGKDLLVMFKDGDDLRQDMLTLQMFRIMDFIWRRNGLDLKMIPYRCVATGDEIGMLEIVTASNTIANITYDMAKGGARSVFDKTVILRWLEQHNPDERDMDEVIERFVASSAGYCVGTYALGIGDRHNDNVMLKENGNFFHIDFGHFLGNYKSKFGIKREKAPFIFTPAMAHVMGGTDTSEYFSFEAQCCEAYNILRAESSFFITLFQLMLSTGIPELQVADDILYIRKSLVPVRLMKEQEASRRMSSLIVEAMNTKTTQMNDAVHILVHQSKDAKADKKADKKAAKAGKKK